MSRRCRVWVCWQGRVRRWGGCWCWFRCIRCCAGVGCGACVVVVGVCVLRCCVCRCGAVVVGAWCPGLLVPGAEWAWVWHEWCVVLCGRRCAGGPLVGDVRRAGGRTAGGADGWCCRCVLLRRRRRLIRCGDMGVVRGCGVCGTSPSA